MSLTYISIIQIIILIFQFFILIYQLFLANKQTQILRKSTEPHIVLYKTETGNLINYYLVNLSDYPAYNVKVETSEFPPQQDYMPDYYPSMFRDTKIFLFNVLREELKSDVALYELPMPYLIHVEFYDIYGQKHHLHYELYIDRIYDILDYKLISHNLPLWERIKRMVTKSIFKRKKGHQKHYKSSV